MKIKILEEKQDFDLYNSRGHIRYKKELTNDQLLPENTRLYLE